MSLNIKKIAETFEEEEIFETKQINDVRVNVGEADTVIFPEGGRGWFVVFGCVFVSFMTFGMINSYGVFLSYYETDLFPNTASSKLSIIGACQASIIYFITPLSLPLIHAFGLRNVLAVGGCFIIVSFFGLSTTSSETQLWKCYLFQAIFFSIGGGLLFPPVMFSPIEWFKKRRAVALGTSMCGVGLGGTVWPIIFKQMIKKHGFQWTVRTIAFLYIPLVLGAVTFIPQHLHPQYVQKEETVSNSKFNRTKIANLPNTYINILKAWLIVLKNKRYVAILCCNLIGMFGSYPAIFYLDYFATVISPASKVTAWLIVIYNIMGAPGRVIPALLADKIGRCNVLIMCLLTAGSSMIAMWIPSIKYEIIGLYIPFVLIFGFAIGPFFSLLPACLGQIFGIVGSDARVGFFLFTSTPGPILGCLIAGSFIPTDSSSKTEILDSFYKLVIYAGVLMLCCAFIMTIVRLSISRKLFVFV